MSARKITRRTFIKGSAGLHLGLYVSAQGVGDMLVFRVPPDAEQDGAAVKPDDLVELGIYVKIDTDGTVTITNPRPDMGQGPRTSLPKHVAEELEVDWSAVRIEQARADSRYGSQTSGGSTSTRTFWTTMRQAGAAAREMLVAAAAQKWGVDPGSCRCELGVVIHDATGRQLTYGELVEEAAKLPVPQNVPLKNPRDYTLVGTPTPRVEGPSLVDGSGVFGMDARVPGMVFAVVARPHPFGGSLADYDDSEALKVPGVRQVMRFGGGVAVVADHTWAALAGRDALVINWNSGPNAEVDSAQIRARLQSRVGVFPSLPREVATPVEAYYDVPYLAHATMEPMNCLVDARANSCEVWAPTQAAGSVQRSVANTLRIPQQNVTVNVTLVGGGFGRRLSVDYATEAARLSRDVGAPVQVVWSRDDDMRHDNYRPASHHALRGGLNGDGQPVAWAHRAALASPSGSLFDAVLLEASEEFGPDQERPPYRIPNTSVETVRVRAPVPTGAWRSVNNTQFTYANECFMDELAAAGGHDPYELRRELTQNSRLRNCLDLAAEKAGWGDPLPEGTGRGMASFVGYGSYAVQVVELSVSPAGDVRVHRAVSAIDCGIAINPLGVQAQMEGGLSDGISTALKAAITIAGGGVEQTSFADYGWLRIDGMPEVEVHIVESTSNPGGMGEVGFPAVSPAVANAIFAATGRRVRRLPIRREDLAGWTGAPTPTPTPTATSEPTPTPTPRPTVGPEGDRIYLPWVGKEKS